MHAEYLSAEQYLSKRVESKRFLDVVDGLVHVPNVPYNVVHLCDSIVKREWILDGTISGQVRSLYDNNQQSMGGKILMMMHYLEAIKRHKTNNSVAVVSGIIDGVVSVQINL